jgi:hypothetical protein
MATTSGRFSSPLAPSATGVTPPDPASRPGSAGAFCRAEKSLEESSVDVVAVLALSLPVAHLRTSAPL